MKEFESLNFVITLSGSFWDKKPEYSIIFDNEKITHDTITDNKQSVIEFSKEVFPGEHHLDIRLENKTDYDTVVEDGKIIKDMLLNIDSIEIDDIPLNNLLWSAEYILDKPKKIDGQLVESLTKCVNLGWNGTYRLKFSSPFYVWLLENL